MAQKAAVGRRLRREPGQALAGFAALGDGQPVGGQVDQRVGRQPGLGPGAPGTLEPVAHLTDRGRPADERDPLVPELDEVLDGETAAEDVVDGDGAERVGRRGCGRR